jgi:hypothetical protein
MSRDCAGLIEAARKFLPLMTRLSADRTLFVLFLCALCVLCDEPRRKIPPLVMLSEVRGSCATEDESKHPGNAGTLHAVSGSSPQNSPLNN